MTKERIYLINRLESFRKEKIKQIEFDFEYWVWFRIFGIPVMKPHYKYNFDRWLDQSLAYILYNANLKDLINELKEEWE